MSADVMGRIDMRQMIRLLTYLMLIPASGAMAQDRGQVSLFGGYSYSTDVFHSKNGWDASIAANVWKHFAIVADISGYYASYVPVTYSFSPTASTQDSRIKYRDYSFMFGPRYLQTPGKKWTPFAHVLFGAYRGDRNVSGPIWNDADSGSFSALAVGGGLDVALNNRISLRAVQVDYFHLGNNGPWGRFGRVAFGVVFPLKKSLE
jgi:hypothetical protein